MTHFGLFLYNFQVNRLRVCYWCSCLFISDHVWSWNTHGQFGSIVGVIELTKSISFQLRLLSRAEEWAVSEPVSWPEGDNLVAPTTDIIRAKCFIFAQKTKTRFSPKINPNSICENMNNGTDEHFRIARFTSFSQ